MRLFHHPVSSNSRRALMAAIHLNIELDLGEVDLMNADDRRRLLELNPNGMVPVLQDGDFLLPESCAIMQYLAEQTPGQTIYPESPRLRADVNRWMFWATQHFAPAVSVLTWERIWKGMVGFGAPDMREIERGERDLAQFCAVLDMHLAGREWVVGDNLTLADFALAAPLMYTVSARLPVTGYANLMAWFGRVQQLDAWKHTDPVW